MSRFKSWLYDCRVVHARFAPREHRLSYRLFWFAIDLEEAARLPRWGWLGTGALSIYRFRASDHLGFKAGDLRERLQDHLGSQGIPWDGTRCVLITQLRFLGYVFNPVSFYYCWNADGRPAAALAEVGNTYGEMKLYAMGPAHLEGTLFRLRVPKYFYVSPFSDLTTEFEFRIPEPGSIFSADVDDYKDGTRILMANLRGERRELSRIQLLRSTLRFPAITLGIIVMIHWNALLIWLKGVPHHAKAAHPEDQREVIQPR